MNSGLTIGCALLVLGMVLAIVAVGLYAGWL